MNIDEMIAKALDEEFEERVEQCSADTKKHRFSPAYRLWERKMLRDLRRGSIDKRWTLKKARVVLGIAAVSVLVGGTAFAAVNMGRYSFDDKRDYSKMLIEQHPSDKTAFEEYYGLPEEDGWEITNFGELSHVILISYKRGDQIVSFEQSLIYEGNMGNLNTENTVIEPMSLYENNDGILIELPNNECGIFWIYNGYLLSINGNLDKKEIIDLVYSTEIINLPKNLKKCVTNGCFILLTV